MKKYYAGRLPKNGIPALLIDSICDNQIRVWCPYCRDFHYHGGTEGGHRAAHCIEKIHPSRKEDII